MCCCVLFGELHIVLQQAVQCELGLLVDSDLVRVLGGAAHLMLQLALERLEQVWQANPDWPPHGNMQNDAAESCSSRSTQFIHADPQAKRILSNMKLCKKAYIQACAFERQLKIPNNLAQHMVPACMNFLQRARVSADMVALNIMTCRHMRAKYHSWRFCHNQCGDVQVSWPCNL